MIHHSKYFVAQTAKWENNLFVSIWTKWFILWLFGSFKKCPPFFTFSPESTSIEILIHSRDHESSVVRAGDASAEAFSKLCFAVHLLWIRHDSRGRQPSFSLKGNSNIILLTDAEAWEEGNNKNCLFADWIKVERWIFMSRFSSMRRSFQNSLTDGLLTFMHNWAMRLKLNQLFPKWKFRMN